MEWYYWAMAGIAGLGFIGSIVGTVAFLTWRLADIAAQLKADTEARVKAVENHANELADILRREFGETAKAIQAKVHQFELWSRDEFVRKQSFMLVIGETKKMIEDQGDRIEKRLDRMEGKIDNFAAQA